MRRYLISRLFIFIPLTLPSIIYAQIKCDTIIFNGIKIECSEYKIESDTILLAYCDKKIRASVKTYTTYYGQEYKSDLTFDSLFEYLRTKYPKRRVSLSKTNLDAELKSFADLSVTPDKKFKKVFNHFWIGAINHYSNKLKQGQTTDENYFGLAYSLTMFHDKNEPSTNDRAIEHLDSVIQINRKMTKAYILKAELHKENGYWKGRLSSDPHINNIIDQDEIDKGISTINELLSFEENLEARNLLSALLVMKYK